MSDPVIVHRPAPGVACITLNRPERLNAITIELVNALHDALDDRHPTARGSRRTRTVADPRPGGERRWVEVLTPSIAA
jgi:hypothetical protein